MKRILILSYYFPPLGYAGVQRALKFVKYLPRFGWEPHVLTVKDVVYEGYDAGLLKQLPSNVTVSRSGSVDPLRLLFLLSRLTLFRFTPNALDVRARYRKWSDWFLLPDNKIGWAPFCLMKALRLVRKKKFDAILSTGPPFTSHLVGAVLQRLTGIPLVLDYRDPWTIGTLYRFPTRVHHWINDRLQDFCLKSASRVVVVNEAIIPSLNKSSKAPSEFIPNGFDAEDFVDGELGEIGEGRTQTIVYGGRIYNGDQLRQMARALLEFNARNQPTKRIELRLLGTGVHKLNGALSEEAYSQVLKFEPYLSHKAYCEALQKADLLWLTLGEDEESTRIPAKLYHYIGAGKPIVATVPKGSMAARVLTDAGVGIVVEQEDRGAIVEILEDLVCKSGRWQLPHSSSTREGIQRYEYSHLTSSLVAILDRC